MPADTLPAELQPLHNWAKRIEEAVLRCGDKGNWHKGDFNAGLYGVVELWAWNLPYAPDNAEETALVHLASKYPTHEQGLRGKLAKCDQVRERVRRQQERWEFPPKDLYAAEDLIVEAGRFAHQINCVVDAIAKETQQPERALSVTEFALSVTEFASISGMTKGDVSKGKYKDEKLRTMEAAREIHKQRDGRRRIKRTQNEEPDAGTGVGLAERYAQERQKRDGRAAP